MLKNSLIYLFSSILNKLTPFLLIPVLTRFLTPGEYGIVSLYQVGVTFGIALCGFGLHLNLAKAYPELEEKEFGKFTFNVFLVLCISSTCVFVTCLIILFFCNNFFGVSMYWWITIPIVSFGTMVFLFNQTLLRSSDRPWVYSVFEVSSTILNLIISLFLVIVLSFGWKGRAFGVLLTPLIIGLFSFYYMKREGWISYEINKSKVFEIVIFSLPLLPHTISAGIIGFSDRFILERMVGNDELGLYSVGYSFGMVIMLVTDAFAKSWSPWFLRTINLPEEKSYPQIILGICWFIIAIILLVPIYIVLANFLIPYIVGKEFVSSSKYISIISFSYLFFGIYQLFFPFLVAKKLTKFLGIISAIGAIINLIFNFLFIGLFGAIGAAWATLFAYVTVSALTTFIALKAIRMPWIKIIIIELKRLKKYLSQTSYEEC